MNSTDLHAMSKLLREEANRHPINKHHLGDIIRGELANASIILHNVALDYEKAEREGGWSEQ